MPSIPALFRPAFRGSPVLLETRVDPGSLQQHVLKARSQHELREIVRTAQLHFFPIWELIPLRTFCDASLQCTLDRISRQIICAIPQSLLQQGLRLFQSNPGELLEISAVHDTLGRRQLIEEPLNHHSRCRIDEALAHGGNCAADLDVAFVGNLGSFTGRSELQ